jgi:hypothetical protein
LANCSFIYDNFISDYTKFYYVTDTKKGIVSAAVKNGTGSALMPTQGDFTGSSALDLEYIVEIDLAGEVGTATFKWTDTPGSWTATGVTTSSSWITLSYGVQVRFLTGTGTDCELGDSWFFKGINTWSIGNVLRYDRDKTWRSEGVSQYTDIRVDFGEAKIPKVVILYDHNISSAGVINFQGNSSDVWTSPGFTTLITRTESRTIKYINPPSFRYWRLTITNPTNPDGYIDLSHYFLGNCFIPEKNFDYGSGNRSSTDIIIENSTLNGIVRRSFLNRSREFRYNFSYITDIDTLFSVYESLGVGVVKQSKALFFHEDSSSTVDFWMTWMDSLDRTYSTHNTESTSITLREVLRSV